MLKRQKGHCSSPVRDAGESTSGGRCHRHQGRALGVTPASPLGHPPPEPRGGRSAPPGPLLRTTRERASLPKASPRTTATPRPVPAEGLSPEGPRLPSATPLPPRPSSPGGGAARDHGCSLHPVARSREIAHPLLPSLLLTLPLSPCRPPPANQTEQSQSPSGSSQSPLCLSSRPKRVPLLHEGLAGFCPNVSWALES